MTKQEIKQLRADIKDLEENIKTRKENNKSYVYEEMLLKAWERRLRKMLRGQ